MVYEMLIKQSLSLIKDANKIRIERIVYRDIRHENIDCE